MTGYVYMTASQKRGTIYIGVTNDLGAAFPSTSAGAGSRFTARYGVQRLVWYEEHFDIRDAIQREKSLKRWPRQWKIDLIEKINPEWFELFAGWVGEWRRQVLVVAATGARGDAASTLRHPRA